MEKTNPEKLIEDALNLAELKLVEGQYNLTEILANQILKIDESNIKAIKLLGLAKHGRGDSKKAKEIFENIIDKIPDDIELLNNLALCHSVEGGTDVAISILEKAIKIDPNKYHLYSNLGLQYRKNNEYEKAIFCFEKSISLNEKSFDWCMLGGCYGELLNLDKAEFCFLRALEIDPDSASIHVDLAYCYHLKKQYKLAWEHYEKRYDVFPQTKVWKNIYNPEKSWKGEDLTNKTLLVYSEQGMGDTIQFVRYLKQIKNCQIIFHCSSPLEKIVLPFVDKVITNDPATILPWHIGKDEKIPNHDYHVSVISLPYVLKTEKTFPESYIFIEEKTDLSKYKEFKIGIVWAGSPLHPQDRLRSCHLENFRAITKIPGTKIFSLQKDLRPRKYHDSLEIDFCSGCEDMKIIDMSPFMNDFHETAKVLNSLDLIISVDTSVAHLAGAMGIETWLLLPYNPDWRWGLNEEKTEWYNSMQIFRQKTRKNWDNVFKEVEKKLKHKLNQ